MMKVRADLFAGVLPFVLTAEQRSFGKAAASLGVTTAAVSKSLRRLEEDLGVRLLDRSSRVVSLTREGEEFLERCQQAVLGVRGAREAMASRRSEPHGEIVVTLPITLADFVVPKLTGLSALYPRLSYRLELTDRIARLGMEGYDVAVRLGTLEDSTLVSKLLRRVRWVTVASPAYLATHAEPRRPEDLASHNCLRFVGPKGRPVVWTFKAGSQSVPFPATGNLLIDHGGYLLAAVHAGLGVGQVFDFMVEGALRSGELVEVLPAFSAAGPDIHALATQARAGSANVRAFFRFLGETFRSS
ncbi:MAG: LysR family transcriptional regulator [Labilithrix sp.]